MMAKTNKGFTLVEMIAALAIFSVVITIFVSSFLSLLAAERKGAAVTNIQDNLRFALEVMAKEIRTGNSYSSPTPESFSFTNAKGEAVTYQLCGTRLEKTASCNPAAPVPLTSDQIEVEDLRFYVSGEDPFPADTLQPKVTITIKATAEIRERTAELNLQTTVSQRAIDL